MHAHNIYFALNVKSEEIIAEFMADSKKYLAVQPGIISFACGVRETALDRPINDRDFDVSLHVLFDSKAAHDAYQVAPLHNEFVARQKDNWKVVRVFDTAVR
jgi:hypothetical protein